jgi:hypothetical protein
MALWRKAKPDHPIVLAYLRGRGIGLDRLPSSLRWMRSWCPESHGDLDAMVALITHAHFGPVAIQLTWITRGRRVCRRTYGPSSGGGVMLMSWHDGMPLVLAEGTETALSAAALFGCPAWSTCGTSGMSGILLPGFVKDVIVASDNGDAGRDAAAALSRRLALAGRRVRIALPPPDCDDFNTLAKRKFDA